LLHPCVFICFSDYGRVLWRKVFVKALPTTADSLADKFLFIGDITNEFAFSACKFLVRRE
uniref:hypothetical protein n=1 Tax=Prevotella sp. TaxID=59823 RepID=UPI0040264FF0